MMRIDLIDATLIEASILGDHFNMVNADSIRGSNNLNPFDYVSSIDNDCPFYPINTHYVASIENNELTALELQRDILDVHDEENHAVHQDIRGWLSSLEHRAMRYVFVCNLEGTNANKDYISDIMDLFFMKCKSSHLVTKYCLEDMDKPKGKNDNDVPFYIPTIFHTSERVYPTINLNVAEHFRPILVNRLYWLNNLTQGYGYEMYDLLEVCLREMALDPIWDDVGKDDLSPYFKKRLEKRFAYD